MAPPNPKRPPRPPRPPGTQASQDSDVELPFDDDEVDPLQADDPRPQRVPQYPAGSRKSRRHGPGARGNHDRELASGFDTSHEYSDPGYAPAFLYVERGPGAGQLVPVKQGSLVMGRSSSSDLRLQHPSISRRHAHLTRRGDRFFLKDLSSQNGTFLNRHRIASEVELMPGDEISLGNALLRLRGHGGTPALGVPVASAAEAPRPRRGLSSLGVALAAAAVGSGVAALIALFSLRAAGDAEAPPSPNEGAAPLAAHGTPTSNPGGAGTAGTAAPDARAGVGATGVAAPQGAHGTGSRGAGAGTAPSAAGVNSEAKPGTNAVHSGAAPESSNTRSDREPSTSRDGSGTTPRTSQEPVTPTATGISALNVARGTTKQVRPVSVTTSERATTGRDASADIERQAPSRTADPGSSPRSRAPDARPRTQAPSSGDASATAPTGTGKETEVLRFYEAGNVTAAKELAQTENLTGLHEQLVRFETAAATARKAQAKGDLPEAIAQLSIALSVDDALAHGWSKHGPPLRKQLSRLHLQVGVDHVAAGRSTEARTAFEQALKHDTGNREAREHLARLSGASAP
ncbi:FHA domain-containing protein [Myxococcus hansupus]|uniref:FHA domain-containing protein n=1 Tax=Pseudomyxococcus hansupus TaxID=1297742 RepID=UPI0009E3E9C9|nr:FHA domain-containing protein [Myxococcus hansupus]